MGPRVGPILWREGKSPASANKKPRVVQPLDYHYIDLAATLWMLIIIPYADVLGLYAIQHKTVLLYTNITKSGYL